MPVAIARFQVFANQTIKIDYLSAGCASLMGYPLTQLLASDWNFWLIHLHPDDIDTRLKSGLEALFTATSAGIEFRLRHHDGSWHWLLGQFTCESITLEDSLEDCRVITLIALEITTQKQAELGFQQNYEEYQRILRFFPDLLFRVQSDGTIVDYKTATPEYLYVAPEVFLHRRVSDIMPPDVAQSIMQALETATQSGRIVTLEYTLSIANQEEVFEAHIQAIQPHDCLIVARNITNHKQAQIALERSRHLYKELVNSIEGIVWEFDLSSLKFTFVSQQAEQILGYPLERWLNEPQFWESHIHPDDSAWAIEFCNEKSHIGEGHDFEYRMIAADQRTVWLRDIVNVVMRQGQAVMLRGLMVDVTAKRLADSALKRYERIVSATPDGIALVDIHYCYLVINQTYLNWYGQSSQNLIGRPIADLFGQAFFEADIKPHIDRALVGDIVRYQDWIAFPYFGNQFVELTYAPYFESDGLISGVVILVRNLTDLKRAEVALQNQAEREHLLTLITQRIHRSLDLQTILETTVAEVRDFLHINRVLVYRLNGKGSGTVIAESVAQGWMSLLGQDITDECLSLESCLHAYRWGRFQAITDVQSSGLSDCYVQMLSQFQVQASLLFPILQKKQVWGFLISQHCEAPRYWQDDEVDFLTQLTDQLAIALQQSELCTQLQQANEQLNYLANHDSLTQVSNRRHFRGYMQQEWSRLAREQGPLALIFCDVDYFKRYNDTYGHPAGDRCLVSIAKVLRSAVKRPADLIARYGGEEFVIVLPNTSEEGGLRVIQTIQQAIEHLKLPHRTSLIADRVTLSFGLAWTIPSHDIAFQVLIDQADQALYQAKQNGRNGYAVANPIHD